MRKNTEFAFLNIGHFYDHFFMLVFATASALALAEEWGMTYAALIPYATPGFVAFGLCALPAGWAADRWSRRGMMLVFFLGLGFGALFTSLADGPVFMAAGLLVIGVFASIYHPVGLALVIHGREKTGLPLAVNGVFGNMGVAGAALITGWLIDHAGWRAAFAWPGVICLATGLIYGVLAFAGKRAAYGKGRGSGSKPPATPASLARPVLARAFAIVLITTALGGLVFQSTTFALPKVFQERLGDLAASASVVGQFAFYVFALASCGQLVVGFLVDRLPVRLVFASAAGLQAACLAVMVGSHGWAALAVSMAFMLGVFGQIPINDVIIGRITASAWRSRVFALRYIVTFSVMASSVPFLAWIKGNWGFDLLFVVLALAAGLICLTVLALPKAVSKG